MKKKTFTLTSWLFLLLLMSGCKKQIQDVLENELMFNLDANAFLQNQVQFQFVNANATNSTNQPRPTVKISGKDAQLVYDINGGKDVKVEGQFARLVVSPGQSLPADNPAIFKVRAEAPGYLPIEQEVSVMAADSFLTMTLEMIELKNAPQGVRYAEEMVNGGTGTVKVGQSFSEGFSASLTTPSANTVQDANGSRQSLQKLELIQFDANVNTTAPWITKVIPNYSDRLSRDGAELDLSFVPLGYVQVSANGRQQSLQLEKSALMRFYMPMGTIDPLTGEPMQVGDNVQAYQWNEQLSMWQHLEDLSLVGSANGLLMAEVAVQNTGVVVLNSLPTLTSPGNNRCRTNLGVQFRRSSNANTLHFLMVVNATNESIVYDYAENVIVANNTTFNFTRRLPTNVMVKVIVYQYETFSNKGVVLTSQEFRSCDYSTSRRLLLTVNPNNITNNKIARFELDTYCPTSRLFYYHEGRIQYKKVGTSVWYDLGLARRSGRTVTEIIRSRGSALPPVATSSYSFLETDRLENGVSYEFKVSITGRPRTGGANITREFVKTRIFNLTEFEPFTGTSPATYQYQKFKRSYWLANDDDEPNPCAIWGY